MILTKASKFSTTIGICALLITVFFISDVSAKPQQCGCYTSSVRRSHVRHVAYRTRARRTHYARVRTVYRTVYVPRTQVAGYTAYNDEYIDRPATRVVVTEPVYTASYSYGNYTNTSRIARGWGHRDGFKDGYKAALKNRAYNVENNSDFRDADNGYKRRFGSKFLYRSDYRDGYAKGYESGFRAVAGDQVYGTIR
jgi:hypothetical protein